jgi:hypothetical protein
MIWKPDTHQLETIAVLGHARATTAQIAAALGITEAEFAAWAGRLALGRAWSVLPPMPVAKAPKPVAPVDPRIRAERLFEGGVEGDHPIDDRARSTTGPALIISFWMLPISAQGRLFLRAAHVPGKS